MDSTTTVVREDGTIIRRMIDTRDLEKLVEMWERNVSSQHCTCEECQAIMLCAKNLRALIAAVPVAPRRRM